MVFMYKTLAALQLEWHAETILSGRQNDALNEHSFVHMATNGDLCINHMPRYPSGNQSACC